MVKEMDSRPSIGIDFGFPFYMGINTRFTSLMWIKIRFPSYTWIDFRFLLPYWNQHLIPGSWWESLSPNVHKIKELWLWNTSVMEIKYGCQSTMRNNFQENMNMMKKGHLYKGCALIGTRFVQMFIQKLLPAKFRSALTTANRSEFSLSKKVFKPIRLFKK